MLVTCFCRNFCVWKSYRNIFPFTYVPSFFNKFLKKIWWEIKTDWSRRFLWFPFNFDQIDRRTMTKKMIVTFCWQIVENPLLCAQNIIPGDHPHKEQIKIFRIFLPLERFSLQSARFSFLDAHYSLWSWRALLSFLFFYFPKSLHRKLEKKFFLQLFFQDFWNQLFTQA